jgi:hypothetical protein
MAFNLLSSKSLIFSSSFLQNVFILFTFLLFVYLVLMASTNVGHPISFLDNISIKELDFASTIEGGLYQTSSHQQDATWLLLCPMLCYMASTSLHIKVFGLLCCAQW